ncbi:hypothetical protein [Glaciimonas sp. GG7]
MNEFLWSKLSREIKKIDILLKMHNQCYLLQIARHDNSSLHPQPYLFMLLQCITIGFIGFALLGLTFFAVAGVAGD